MFLRWADRIATFFLDLSPERLIAVSRLVLAVFALVATWLDPGQPRPFSDFTYAILWAYLAYAVFAVIAFRLSVGFRAQLASHVIDIAVFALLMHLVKGATSPYFVLFTFALFAGTLRWNWQGALATTFVLVPLFMILQPFRIGNEEDVTRVVIRGGYLLVAGAVLTYLGALRERAQKRLTQLADWPVELVSDTIVPPLERTLRHAASVTGAQRALVVWKVSGEPHDRLASFGEEGFRFASRRPPSNSLVTEELAGRTFLLLDSDGGHIRTRGSGATRGGTVLDPEFTREFQIERAAVAPLRGANLQGHVLLIDIGNQEEGVLALVEIVASHISGQIEHHMLHLQLAQAAAARERIRLARDVHDSSLQTLTAIGLRLAALQAKANKKLQPNIEELRQVVSVHQQRLREFVSASRSPTSEPVVLKPRIDTVLREVGTQWHCQTALRVDPENLSVPAALGTDLALIVMEATSNAVRHGGATRVEVLIVQGQNRLNVEITDDGKGFGQTDAKIVNDEAILQPSTSRSLRDRVQERGGTLVRSDKGIGARIKIELPI